MDKNKSKEGNKSIKPQTNVVEKKQDMNSTCPEDILKELKSSMDDENVKTFDSHLNNIEEVINIDKAFSLNINQKLEILYRLEEIINEKDKILPIAELSKLYPRYFSWEENNYDERSIKSGK